jgi:hypothetical protein
MSIKTEEDLDSYIRASNRKAWGIIALLLILSALFVIM